MRRRFAIETGLFPVPTQHFIKIAYHNA